MRAHDRQARNGQDRAAGGRPGPARAPRPDAALSPVETVAALQRTAGNAAFTAALAAQEQHRHGPGCGHGERPAASSAEPVQRSAVHDVLRTSGSPLEDSVRTDMESRLGADFSDVRIHTDSAAHASAESVDAHAYTSGSHIVFQRGRYDTASSAGRHMLAHELTHVIQQRNGPVAGTDRGDGTQVSDPSDRFEREAEATASRVMSAPATASQDHDQ